MFSFATLRRRAGALARRGEAEVRRRLAARTTTAIGSPELVERQMRDDAIIEVLASSRRNERYDLQTAAVISRVMTARSVGIDVGAHQGEILRRMVTAAPQARHLAIEPLPELADGLRKDFPSVDVHQVALVAAARPGETISFHHVTSNPGYSGILERSYDRPDETVQMIDVRTATLDALVPASVDPHLVKIDVEGAELGVLRGGAETIRRARPVIIFEHGLGASEHYGTGPDDIFDFFSDVGHDVSLLATWLDDGPPLSREQFVEQFEEGRNYYFLAAPTGSSVNTPRPT